MNMKSSTSRRVQGLGFKALSFKFSRIEYSAMSTQKSIVLTASIAMAKKRKHAEEASSTKEPEKKASKAAKNAPPKEAPVISSNWMQLQAVGVRNPFLVGTI